MNKTINILLADDHPLLRKGLSITLSRENNVRIVGEADDGQEAFDMIKKFKPDVAILDIEMPKLSGLDVAKKILEEKLPVKTIILSMYRDENFFNRALDCGVMGYLLKDSAALDIIKCVNTVIRNNYFISGSISDFLIKRRNKEIGNGADLDLSSLSVTEKKILHMIADGKDSKKIAEELYISAKTVENHRAHICKKLNLTGSHVLNKFAATHLLTLKNN